MIFEHVGITVSDLERSIRFYTTIFGFSILRKGTINAYLYQNNELLELMQGDPSTAVPKPQTPEAWQEYMGSAVGVIHLGFRVDDMDEAIQKIVDLGGELIAPPIEYTPAIEYVVEPAHEKLRRAARPIVKPSWRIAMFADPDGVILEILER
jgi:catechol 2,3-dioxygenase-like lactoylglutathione lyase family enzyme